MELHTVGVDAGYTQADVIDASRCLTGHGIDNLGRAATTCTAPATTTTAPSRCSGSRVPAGGGQGDVERLLDHLAAHPRHRALHLAKLAQRFVADDPPEALVARLADVFPRTGGDLREVMKAIFGSAEFWAEAFSAGKPKTGFEYVVSTLRAAGARGREHAHGRAPRSRTRACRSTPATRPPATATAAPTGSTPRRSSTA